MRKTAHVFGVVTLEKRPRFHYRFAPVFNGLTFFDFLKQVVARSRRKIFLIIDNGPCHNLKEEGKLWLAENRHRIELFRLPPYSPEYNAIEGVWKVTKKRTTHNRFYKTVEERDAALCATFGTFQAHPKLIAARLGHSTITITLDRYGHLFPSVEEALAEQLDAAFNTAAPESNVAGLRR